MENVKPVIEMELYLVRHGESYGNVPADYRGRLPEDEHDPRLTPKGERQVRLLGEHFSTLALDCVMSSGLRRAMNTAQAVIERQPQNGARVLEVHPIFTESGAQSEHAYKTEEQIKSIHKNAVFAPGAWEYTLEAADMSHEDDAIRLERGKRTVEYLRLRFKNGEKVLVAAHGCFNTFIYFAALGLAAEQVFDPVFYNTGVTKFIFYAEGTGPYGISVGLAYQNDHTHLLNEFPDMGF